MRARLASLPLRLLLLAAPLLGGCPVMDPTQDDAGASDGGRDGSPDPADPADPCPADRPDVPGSIVCGVTAPVPTSLRGQVCFYQMLDSVVGCRCLPATRTSWRWECDRWDVCPRSAPWAGAVCGLRPGATCSYFGDTGSSEVCRCTAAGAWDCSTGF